MVEDISVLGRFLEIHKKLIERTISLGGDHEGASVRKLLSDPALLDEVAKKIVGPIWELVGKTFELNVDWDSSLSNLMARANGSVNITGTLFEVDGKPYFNDYVSQGRYRYTLVHFENPITFDEVASRFGVAGFRELCAFFSFYFAASPSLVVYALDSKIPPHEDCCGGYVCGARPQVEGKAHITYSTRTGKEKFNCSSFFLVRVP